VHMLFHLHSLRHSYFSVIVIKRPVAASRSTQDGNEMPSAWLQSSPRHWVRVCCSLPHLTESVQAHHASSAIKKP
jgi:hypothetical protein